MTATCAKCDRPRLPNGYCRQHERERGRERYRARVGRPVRAYYRGSRPLPARVAAVEAALQTERDAERLLEGYDADVGERLRAVAEAKRKTAAAIERLAEVVK